MSPALKKALFLAAYGAVGALMQAYLPAELAASAKAFLADNMVALTMLIGLGHVLPEAGKKS